MGIYQRPGRVDLEAECRTLCDRLALESIANQEGQIEYGQRDNVGEWSIAAVITPRIDDCAIWHAVLTVSGEYEGWPEGALWEECLRELAYYAGETYHVNRMQEIGRPVEARPSTGISKRSGHVEELGTRTRQAVLFSGLDCLPGQMDLFSTDGEG